MAYGYGAGFALGNKEIVVAAAGAGVGAIQVIATQAADASTTNPLGTPLIAQLAPTNGQLINFFTGGIALAAGVVGAFGKGGQTLGRRDVQAGLVGYGSLSFFGGWLIPFVASKMAGAAGARRAGAAARPPLPRIALPGGAAPPTTISNQAVIRALTSAG